MVEEFSTGELLLQTAQAALTVIKEYQVNLSRRLVPCVTYCHLRSTPIRHVGTASKALKQAPWQQARTWAGTPRAAQHVHSRHRLQAAQAAFLRQRVAVGALCALVNNNSRCYDDATEFAEHMDEVLDDDCKVRACFLAHVSAAEHSRSRIETSYGLHPLARCNMNTRVGRHVRSPQLTVPIWRSLLKDSAGSVSVGTHSHSGALPHALPDVLPVVTEQQSCREAQPYVSY